MSPAPDPDHGIRLNPPKGERRVWYAEDQVVVVATDHHHLPTIAAEDRGPALNPR